MGSGPLVRASGGGRGRATGLRHGVHPTRSPARCPVAVSRDDLNPQELAAVGGLVRQRVQRPRERRVAVVVVLLVLSQIRDLRFRFCFICVDQRGGDGEGEGEGGG